MSGKHMTLNTLQFWRKAVPFLIAIVCVSPWPLFLNEFDNDVLPHSCAGYCLEFYDGSVRKLDKCHGIIVVHGNDELLLLRVITH